MKTLPPPAPPYKGGGKTPDLETFRRLKVTIRGAVQGVGFRPFIWRLATEVGLKGWVCNSSEGLTLEAEGNRRQLEKFLLRIEKEKPPRSFIQSLESSFLDPVDYAHFTIRPSSASLKTAVLLGDIATCPDCLGEIFEPGNRRYLYPFTNCTNCGPRFTIAESLPYDRPNTTMKHFVLCEACRAEYEDPRDRRFHAQPNACPVCGPHLELWSDKGAILAAHHDALIQVADALRRGAIVAAKGIGGFHLLADARSEEALKRLRARKHREEKPLAVMVGNLEMAKALCEVSAMEERLLCSPEAPIVLLGRKHGKPACDVAQSIAPGNPSLGVMLPYAPLYHLLMRELGFPVVATSGNLSDEPICTNENEALQRLNKIAEVFLVHDRPIARHADDSVARVVLGRELVLRRARGFAPLPVHVKNKMPPLLAVGGHLKDTIAISVGNNIFLSQHIGDLETPQAMDAFQGVVKDLSDFYDLKPRAVACDAHPDYASTRFAGESGFPVIPVAHHYAHVVSCMAENELEGSVLGVSWDGTGYGLDGTIWGGEFLRITDSSFVRVAHLRTFGLPGADQAVREPRRAALGLLWEIFGDGLFAMEDLAPVNAFSAAERKVLKGMLQKKVNTPITSSAGRLFDAVAAIVGLRQQTRFEGQAAMELEFALEGIDTQDVYSFCMRKLSADTRVLDWEPMMREIFNDVHRGTHAGIISAKFHNTLAEMIVTAAKTLREERVVLSGGCFQNRYLTIRTVERLTDEGFRSYWHQRIPPNDGGIALGQIVAAAQSLEKGR